MALALLNTSRYASYSGEISTGVLESGLSIDVDLSIMLGLWMQQDRHLSDHFRMVSPGDDGIMGSEP